MKKVLLFILTFAYLASTSGATICFHECMGKTIGWTFAEKAPEQCTKCGMHKNASNDCCTAELPPFSSAYISMNAQVSKSFGKNKAFEL